MNTTAAFDPRPLVLACVVPGARVWDAILIGARAGLRRLEERNEN